MPSRPELGIDAVLDLSGWSRGVQALLRDDPKISSAMESIADSIDEVTTSLDDFDGDISASVSVEVDDSGLADLATSIEEVEGVHPLTVETEADPSVLDPYNEAIGNIIAKAGQAVLAVAALGGAAVTGALAIGVRAVTDLDDALDSVEARARTDIPEAGQIIQDTFEQGLGESRDQIGQTITLASQLGVANEDLGTATETAFRTALVTGDDVMTTLRTMQTLVRTGLVPDFETAGDLLVTGFQDGANRAGDLNTTLTNNAGVLSDMGFNGEEAMGLIVTGLDNGYDSAGELVNQLLIVRQRLVENSDTVKEALAGINQTDEAQAYLNGTLSGGQFMQGLADAISAAPQDNRLDLISAIFGPRGARDLSEEQVAGLAGAQEALDAYKGNLQEASNILLTDFDPTVQRIFRKAEDRVGEFLSSEQIDLPGKIAAIEAAFNTFLDQLEAGAGVGEALEIAIDVPGLADQINHFESIVGNLIINLGEFAAEIADSLGNSTLATQIRESFAPLAKGQLQFDLDVATSQDEIMQAVSTASARGLSSAAVNDALQNTIQTAFAAGDFDALQNLIDSISALQGEAGNLDDLTAQALALTEERNNITGFGALTFATPEEQTRLEEIDAALADINQQMMIVQTGEGLKLDIDTGDLVASLQNAEREAFGTALENKDFDAAQVIATRLGDPLLQQIATTMQQAQQATQAGMNQLMASIYSPTPGFTPGAGAQAGTAGAQGAQPPPAGGMKPGAGANPLESVNQFVDAFTLNVQTKAPMIDQSLQLVSDGTTEINTTAQTALPAAQQVFSDVALQMIEDWTPVLLLFQQTYEAMEALQSAGGGGGGGAGSASGTHPSVPTHDRGGWLHRGEMTMINGEPFVSPGDAFALGLPNRSMMSRFGLVAGAMGGGNTTNTHKNISVNNNMHVQSQAQAAQVGLTVANELRGF